jgi:hypothetical protein
MFPKDIEPFIWWLLSYPSSTPSYITPHFRTYDPHLRILALERKRRAQEWEFTCDFREKRGFCSNFQDFSSHRSLWSEKNFSKYETLNFSHNFQTQGIFVKLQAFSFIEPHETNFFIMDCKNLFSPKYYEIHLGIEWDMFLHDPELKSYHMKSCSVFQFLVEFSSLVHDFGCSSILSSLWV